MHSFTPQQIAKTIAILKANGIACRDDLNKYDKSSGLENIKQIGAVRGEIVRWLRSLLPQSFSVITGLPIHDDKPVEGWLEGA